MGAIQQILASPAGCLVLALLRGNCGASLRVLARQVLELTGERGAAPGAALPALPAVAT